jgi:hypothetical protein
MRSAIQAAARVRLASVLFLGAFGVHQLRYLLAYGEDAGNELARQGHAYMADALPVLGGFVIAAIAATALRAGLGPEIRRAGSGPALLGFSTALLVVFCGQELIEGSLAAGHPAGLNALLEGGGWLALPLSLLIGSACALVTRALERVEQRLAASPEGSARPRAPRTRGQARREHRLQARLSPLGFGLARRPPPPVPA